MGAFDFSGWATRNDLLCSDGRTIRKDAFKENDGQVVPLVWNHQHNDPLNVLGHALLENRKDGVYAYCTFNDTEAGIHAKELVQHGDVSALSIYANQLKQKGSDVLHGAIREVSLVFAGANPGAFIDSIMAHGEFSKEEAIIYTGEEISLSHAEPEEKKTEELKPAEPTKELKPEVKENEKMAEAEKKEKTVKDVFDELTEEQKTVVYAMIGEALNQAKGGKEEEDSEEEEKDMKHNVFNTDVRNQAVLMHAFEQDVIADAKRYGSLKDSYLAHAEDSDFLAHDGDAPTYGIDHIDYLFPDAKAIENTPGFIKRNPDAWVDVVMNGVHHTPFSRIKMLFADITGDEARAKGYIKGSLKKEEVFSLLKRTVTPTTIYKKQKLDRDDVIDITDFDVVAWLKGEMRMMLDEEIARAILFGDGRTSMSDDKISETNIIPVVSDASLYTLAKPVAPGSGESLGHALITAAVKAQDEYEGSGNLTMFAAASTITDMLLMEDADGHRLYKDMNELAMALNVNKIVKVPASIVPSGVYAVIVDLKDYNVGADKGGSVNMFDDFDIDYNAQKYLIETRCSGALVKPYSAIVLKAE